MARFPHSVFDRGDEPDVRFTLANERTLLAWLRTSLALLAAGVALEILGLQLHTGLRLAASLVLVVAGVVTPCLAWLNWMRTERAMRLSEPLPTSLMGPTLTIAVTVAGVLVGLGVLFR